MLKYKRKRKKNITMMISIAIIAILISINIGYALWSDRLDILGDVNLKYVEPKLENLTLNTTEGEYISIEEDYGIKAVTLNSTSVTDDNIFEVYGEFEVGTWVVVGRDVDLSISFTNNNQVALTSPTYEILEKSLDYDITFTLPETVPPGETATLNMRYYIRSSMKPKTGNVKIRVAYKVEEITKYLYFTINIVRA